MKPILSDSPTPIRLAMLGMIPGNGHPYSWSAIVNGYDPQEMAKCPYPAIPNYLGAQPLDRVGIPGARVTHVWTDDASEVPLVAAAAKIPHVVDRPEDVIGHVDGLVSPDPGAYAPPHHPNPVDYGAVKAGLLQMSRYFSVYYGACGIRSNCITPGPFPQPNYQNQSLGTAAALVAKVPVKRFGRAEEIAGPTLFLLSDAASYVTGQSLGVDGGWTAW